jgi:hypothetical protein
MEAIDWTRELRRIEREYDGLPPEPSAAVVKARRAAEQRAREESERRRAGIGVLARLALVSSLFAALWWWPYAADCGVGLAGLVGAESMIAVGGLWTALFAWRHRLGAGHVVALLLLVAGTVLVSAEVLTRQGYVKIAGVEAAGWSCSR